MVSHATPLARYTDAGSPPTQTHSPANSLTHSLTLRCRIAPKWAMSMVSRKSHSARRSAKTSERARLARVRVRLGVGVGVGVGSGLG